MDFQREFRSSQTVLWISLIWYRAKAFQDGIDKSGHIKTVSLHQYVLTKY